MEYFEYKDLVLIERNDTTFKIGESYLSCDLFYKDWCILNGPVRSPRKYFTVIRRVKGKNFKNGENLLFKGQLGQLIIKDRIFFKNGEDNFIPLINGTKGLSRYEHLIGYESKKAIGLYLSLLDDKRYVNMIIKNKIEEIIKPGPLSSVTVDSKVESIFQLIQANYDFKNGGRK